MTTTQAVHTIMDERARLGQPPISLMELQTMLRVRFGIIALDGSCSRRLREMGAHCRIREGTKRTYEYYFERPVQGVLLPVTQEAR